MRRKSISISLSILVGACAALAAAPSPVQETASVSLVEVPVTVLGKDDKPVRGLTAEDFEIRDEGKPVAIQGADETEFRTISSSAPQNSESVPVNAAARRRFLLLFDLSYSSTSRITRIREAARKFVLQQIGPDDLAAVATFSVDHGLNLVITFTPDRAQLAAAVETLGFANTSEKSPDLLQLTTLMNVSDQFEAGATPPPQGNKKISFTDEIHEMSLATKRGDDARRRGQVLQLVQSFGSLAKALDSVDGRKQIIYFSQGFDMRLLQGNAQDAAATREQNENAVHGLSEKIDSEARFGSADLQSTLNEMLELFKRSDCVIHAVDLSGLTAVNDTSDPSAGSGQAALFAIAKGTGGELFSNANDFSGRLDKLLEEQSVVYVLTFSPKLTGHPDKYHALKVSVKRSGLRISSRPGYYEPKLFSKASSVERKFSAADVIASEMPIHDVPASILAVPFPGREKAEVPVLVHISGKELTAGSSSNTVPVEIYGYVFSAAGKVVDFFSQSVTLDLAKVGPRISEGGLVYFVGLGLAPGEYRLKVLVRNSETGKMGFWVERLVVPVFSPDKPYLSRPLAVPEKIRGLVVRGRAAHAPGDAEQAPFPFMAGNDPFLPEPDPAVAPGGTMKICLFSYNLGGTGKSPNLQIGGQVLQKDGRMLQAADLAFVGRTAPDTDGRTTYLLNFKPGPIASGDYLLRILMQDPGSGTARQASTPIQVR